MAIGKHKCRGSLSRRKRERERESDNNIAAERRKVVYINVKQSDRNIS